MVKLNNNPLFQILKKSQVRELIEQLSSWYDCNLEELKSYNFYLNTRGKVFISKINLDELDLNRINAVGLYFGTYHDETRFRLSIEATQLIKPKQNFVILKEENLKSYLAAENLFKEEVKEINWQDNCPFLIVQYKQDNIGSVSINSRDDFLINYIPKSRKLDFNKVF